MTDAQRMWVLLRDAGTEGQHSHDLRKLGVSGNPSQRAKDIVSKGVPIFTAREARNGRPGSRYWLSQHAPDWAVAVRGNHEVEPETKPVVLVCDAVGPEIRFYERPAA